MIELDVRPWNDEARAVYERWGFQQSKLTLATKAEDLEQRLSQDAPAPSHGLVFAQTDDETRVAKAVPPTFRDWAARPAPTSTLR